MQQLQAASLRVRVITGDNAFTAAEIARECGILRRERALWLLKEDAAWGWRGRWSVEACAGSALMRVLGRERRGRRGM